MITTFSTGLAHSCRASIEKFRLLIWQHFPSPLLSSADMGQATIVVDCVKNKYLKPIMFARLCEEMSETHFIFLP